MYPYHFWWGFFLQYGAAATNKLTFVTLIVFKPLPTPMLKESTFKLSNNNGAILLIINIEN